MSEYSTISFDKRERVAILTLDRPDALNALNPEMLDEIITALRGIEDDLSTNALVITGTGRLFSAGVDLTTPYFMENVDDNSVYAGKRLLDGQHRLIEAIHGLPFLTLAAMNGDAVGGGGFGIAMACDMRFAVRSARMWMVPSALDVVQDFGLSWLLQQQIGASRTLHMAVTGKRVKAEEALTWGLVHELVDDQDALAFRVKEFGEQVDGMGPDALRMLKTVVRLGARSTLPEQLQVEAVANGLAFQSEEFQARKAAYLGRLGDQK